MVGRNARRRATAPHAAICSPNNRCPAGGMAVHMAVSFEPCVAAVSEAITNRRGIAALELEASSAMTNASRSILIGGSLAITCQVRPSF